MREDSKFKKNHEGQTKIILYRGIRILYRKKENDQRATLEIKERELSYLQGTVEQHNVNFFRSATLNHKDKRLMDIEAQ